MDRAATATPDSDVIVDPQRHAQAIKTGPRLEVLAGTRTVIACMMAHPPRDGAGAPRKGIALLPRGKASGERHADARASRFFLDTVASAPMRISEWIEPARGADLCRRANRRLSPLHL